MKEIKEKKKKMKEKKKESEAKKIFKMSKEGEDKDKDDKEINLAENYNEYNFGKVDKDIKNIFNNFEIVNKYFSKLKKKNQKYTLSNIQREKIIEDYLLKISGKSLPGISYLIEEQRNFIENLLKHFSKNEIKKLFGLIFENKNDYIIQVQQLKIECILPDLIPEYKTFIVAKFMKKGYYLDYINEKYISLQDDQNISFDWFISKSEFYVISFMTLEKKNETIIKFLEKK